MSRSIQVWVGDQIAIRSNSKPVVVREVDRILLRVSSKLNETPPKIYFEDYQANYTQFIADGVTWYETPADCYFSDCFGHASIRIEFAEEREIIAFDVLAKKTTVEQALRMIQYLSSHDESLIQSCFSRSSLSIGSERADSVDPEMVLSTAETFIANLQTFQPELLNNLRKRLVPIRVPLWKTDRVNCEIDPYDVISNLDALTPSSGDGDVFLRGRNYDLASIDVSKVAPTADVIENHILLGGLYSIRRKLSDLMARLRSYAAGQHNDPDEWNMPPGFESLGRLQLKLSAGGMINRCSSMLNSTEGFIRFFERKVGVRYFGEIMPMMTPYARSTRVYRILFAQLSLWYELGTPSLDGIDFLMKLKSLSKIYELFTWFHLIEQVLRLGWTMESVQPHETMGIHVPSSVIFHQGDDVLSLQYEPSIERLGNDTPHMDLVDMYHYKWARSPFWMPDFVMRLTSGNVVRYLILDAKYSNRATVKEHSLAKLFNKYYELTAVYDALSDTLSNAAIIGIFAVYPLDHQACTYLPMWGKEKLSARPTRLPMVGGIGLMTDNETLFGESLTLALNVLRRTLSLTSC